MKPSSGQIFCLVLLALLPALAVAQAPEAATPPPVQAVEAPIGALWAPAAGAAFRDQLRFDRFVQELQEMPFTEFLIQVRANADAYYDSKIVPRASGVPDRFDPLASMIEALHTSPNPKRVIAWIDPYHVGNLNDAAPLDSKHLLTAHHDWLSLRSDGSTADANGDMYLEPGLPAVQEHLEAVVRELVERYRVDGVYFDHMGDPASDGEWGYHPEILQRWAGQSNGNGNPGPDDPRWLAFRAEIMTSALERLVQTVHRAQPDLPVGVNIDVAGSAPASERAFYSSDIYRRTRQDFPTWLTIKGLSRFYVRNFMNEQSGRLAFDGWMQFVLALGRESGGQIVIGVSGRDNEALDALAQLRRAAEAGAAGLALWNYNQPVRDRGSKELFLGAIGRTVFSPDHLRSMAVINRARSEPIRLPVITRDGQESTTATEVAALPAGVEPMPDNAREIDLPPPPTVDEVTDESTTRGAPEDPEHETMAALDRLIGLTSPQPILKPAAIRPSTRVELIEDLLSDPQFRQSADYQALWGTEIAARELKKKFDNIF
jgi:uncharacterized lipoprotein YddW (UPF0748 family)